MFLRFPGQWEDESWSSTKMPSGLYQNVHRWYGAPSGRYLSPDPILSAANPFDYAQQRPTLLVDVLGLRASPAYCCQKAFEAGLFYIGNQEALGIPVCCDGTKIPCASPILGVVSNPMASTLITLCVLRHEGVHLPDIDCPSCGITSPPPRSPSLLVPGECRGYAAEAQCLNRHRPDCGSDLDCHRALLRRQQAVMEIARTFGCQTL